MGTPFGFMAFLGVASLIGVIVSHSSCCSTHRGDARKREPMERALPTPALSVSNRDDHCGATILALFPLDSKVARSGNLCAMPDRRPRRRHVHHLAAGAGLLRDFCLDLKWIKWKRLTERQEISEANPPLMTNARQEIMVTELAETMRIEKAVSFLLLFDLVCRYCPEWRQTAADKYPETRRRQVQCAIGKLHARPGCQ